MRVLGLMLVIIGFMLSFGVKGQKYLGLHSSNYSGAKGLTVNPANAADNRYYIDVNVFNIYSSFANTYVGFQQSAFSQLANANLLLQEPHFAISDDQNVNNNLLSSNEVSFLNLLFNKGKHGFGVEFRVRQNVGLTQIDDDLFQAIVDQFNAPSIFGIPMKHEGLQLQSHSWYELGVTYGSIIREGNHFMKFGVKPKLTKGLSSAFLMAEPIEATILNDSTISLSDSQISYGSSENFNLNPFKSFLSSNPLSFGIDIGIIYEWRPGQKDFLYEMNGDTNLVRKDQNKYKLKLALSILDLGNIKYNTGNNWVSFNTLSPAFGIKNMGVNNVNDISTLIENRFTTTSEGNSLSVALPRTLNFQLDYHIAKDFYVNFTAHQSMVAYEGFSTKELSMLSVTPRWDRKNYGVYIPVSYNEYSEFNVGLAAMIGPFTLGTRNVFPAFSSGASYNMDFFFGISTSSMFMAPQDQDGDHVSDDVDDCIDIPGLWKNKGCPDKDDDGVIDSKDNCPDIPGKAAFSGCPDTDNDLLVDSLDQCPYLAGDIHGCPDSDGDKVVDSEDFCPEVFGDSLHNGCPDTDFDGIFDDIDECPSEAGDIENKGCPDTDTDRDGIVDRIDRCPDEIGLPENQGCPSNDFDDDGILNDQDACPRTKGPIENNGCPIIEKEDQEILNTAFNNLEFETGKANIIYESLDELDSLAGLLQKRPTWKLQISGHTDNVGRETANLLLSKRRAESVRKYLILNDVDPKRVIIEYFGSSQPIESNNTEEGRSKNRRVELKVIFD